MLRVYATDNLTRIDEITGYARLEVVERDLDSGFWELRAPLTDSNSPTLHKWLTADEPGIEVHDVTTGWRFGGLLTEDETIDRPGDHSNRDVVASGVDFMAELDFRLIWPGGFDVVSEFWQYNRDERNATIDVNAQQIILEALVDLNGGVAGYRYPTYPHTVLPSSSTGPNTTINANGRTPLELARELLAGTVYTARNRLTVDEVQTQNIAGVQAPRTTAEVFERPTAETPLDVRSRNVEEVRRRRVAAETTSVLGVGDLTGNAGQPAQRHVARGSTATTGWQTRYRESFVNRPTASLATLQDEVDRAAVAGGPKTIVTALNPTIESWGSDLDIGWLAPVNVPVGATYERALLPVVKSTLVDTPAKRWQRTVEFGSEDLRDSALIVAAIARLDRLAELNARGLNDT